jgi:CRP-like cAMP-binding protein
MELVHTYVSRPGSIASFGELALLHPRPRTAMVRAKVDGVVWSLHRAPFRQVCVGRRGRV